MAEAPYIPTPAEIRKARKKIRRGWSPGEERQRRTGSAERQRVEPKPIPTPQNRHGEYLA